VYVAEAFGVIIFEPVGGTKPTPSTYAAVPGDFQSSVTVATAARLVQEQEHLRTLDPEFTIWYRSALEILFPKRAKPKKTLGRAGG